MGIGGAILQPSLDFLEPLFKFVPSGNSATPPSHKDVRRKTLQIDPVRVSVKPNQLDCKRRKVNVLQSA